ncbi:MAG: hypothetical protein DRJ63_10430 [Thermoprotei archaeon]|nr:MAG: hypothetical protein DRJ63_10430 [Thermoprotei archaeon]
MMSVLLEKEVLEILKEINSKLDTVVAKLEVLEEKVIEVEEPEPEDVEAYYEAEKELREGKLIPFKKK